MNPGWAPTTDDLSDLAGEHVHRSRRRNPWLSVVAAWFALLGLWVFAIALGDRGLLAVALFCTILELAVARPWRVRTWSTSIALQGIDLELGSGRVHLGWADVREVYVAGAWQPHSTVRTARNQEFPLPGLDRPRAARLADLVRSHR